MPGLPSQSTRVFPNRCVAGRELAAELVRLALRDPVVLALPRGGVPVAYEIAHLLSVPLDVLVVRKVGAPGHSELAIGAVAPGVIVSDDEVLAMMGVERGYFERAAERVRREVEERVRLFRGDRPPLELRGKTAIVVDDGLATGSTMRAAVGAVRQLGAAQVIVAVPVGSQDACDRLAELADRVVCLATPEPFGAVGYWYEDFTQTSDEEVRRLLRLAGLEHEARFQPASGG